jgi:hypothetical protein
MYTYDENLFSDLHKDTFGFRPRGHEFYEADPARKQVIWDELLEQHELAMDLEAQEQIAALNAFELEIATAIDVGARSREDAIRWIVQSLELDDIDLMYGGSAICYRKRLPYKMTAIFDNAINQLNYEVA